jgi:TonB family protein
MVTLERTRVSDFFCKNSLWRYFRRTNIPWRNIQWNTSKWLVGSVFLHVFGFLFVSLFILVKQNFQNQNELIYIDFISSETKVTQTEISPKIIELPSKLKPTSSDKALPKDSLVISATQKNHKETQVLQNENPNPFIDHQVSKKILNHDSDIKSLYISKLVEQIDRQKVYPRTAKLLNQSGEVWVSVDIKKNGELTNPKLQKASPYEKLNQAAMQLIASLKSTAPIPEELHLETWQVVIPIAYVLR